MQAHHNNHVFSHQNPYHQQADWQHHPHAQTQYAQSQAAAAANAVAQQQQQQQQQAQQQQQQHYGRMTAQNGSTVNSNNMNQSSLGSRDSALEQQQQQQQQQQHGPSSIFSSNGEQMSEENRRVLEWIAQVLNANTRESALLELSKKREQVPELALILWAFVRRHDVPAAGDHLRIPAAEPESVDGGGVESAHIPLFLYPFLNTTSKSRPFEYLRLTSLGVIGALVKNDSSEVIHFLLTTEIIPLCLRIMETGSELSKTVAIFIVQKILLDDMGLQYICQTYERFYAVGTVLSNMVTQLVDQQTVRLLKHVVRCFLR
ncbi:RNA-binding protein, CCR4-NOT complex subunit Rcd1 [Friedmanniomyces endolithicus]|nr:RNA-binding protein, CCR4-NOT complex subunit Rcd1 [Friedmanniomyces endolithicus]